MPAGRPVSLAVLIISLVVLVSVAGYMITGGLMQSGAPTAAAPVAPPANPEKQ